MASVNSVFRLRGRVGNNVFRERNGKTYCASRPTSYKTPQTPEAIARRAKFKLCRAFSNAINRLLYLKTCWNEARPKKKTILGFIFRSNYPFINNGSLELAELSPAAYFQVRDPSASLQDNKITTTCTINSGQGFEKKFSESVISEAVLYLSEPGTDVNDQFIMMSLTSDEKPLLLNEACTFTFPLSEVQMDLINSYSKILLLEVYILKNYESFDNNKGYGINKILVSGTSTIFLK